MAEQTEQTQTTRIKCPHCGWIRCLEIQATTDLATTHVTRGPKPAVKATIERIRELLSDRELAAANAWIDLPDCPNCRQPYRYNVKTGKTQR